MANTKISDLTTASALAAADVAPFVQGGANVKATVQQIITAATGATGTNGETVTTSKPRLDLTQTWNNVATTFTGIKLNVTDTASAAGSLLMDLQVGGSSKFKVSKSGGVLAGNGSGFEMSFGFASEISTGFYLPGTSVMGFAITGNAKIGITASVVRLESGQGLGWSSGSPILTNIDTSLFRDAANTLAQRNGVSAQTFRLYNTFTDASNYERGFMRWNSNVLEIGAEAAGTGSNRSLTLSSPGGNLLLRAGTSPWELRLTTAGHFAPASGNNQDNGDANNTWRNTFRAGYSEVVEMTAPASPSANRVRIFAQDNGAGKTQLMALFATGAAQQLAIEP
jgi:hypothetical protein